MMQNRSLSRARQAERSRARRPTVLGLTALAVLGVGGLTACNDAPPAPSGPGNTYIDDSMQDAVATYTQDATVSDAYAAPVGAGDGSYGGSSDTGLIGASTGYEDASSPRAACSSCSCDERIGFCLENGTSKMVLGSPTDAGLCPFAAVNDLAVGCNTLPADCMANPTCECVLNVVQPPVQCYPECTTAAGYIDVYCQSP